VIVLPGARTSPGTVNEVAAVLVAMARAGPADGVIETTYVSPGPSGRVSRHSRVAPSPVDPLGGPVGSGAGASAGAVGDAVGSVAATTAVGEGSTLAAGAGPGLGAVGVATAGALTAVAIGGAAVGGGRVLVGAGVFVADRVGVGTGAVAVAVGSPVGDGSPS
jgi:hypothetical protein